MVATVDDPNVLVDDPNVTVEGYSIVSEIPPASELPVTDDIRVHLLDLAGNSLGDLVDARIKSCTWKRSGIGKATLQIDPLSPEASKIDLNLVEVQIWFNGVLRWWGIPRRVGGDLNQLEFICESLLSYFAEVFLVDRDIIYKDTEQKTIVAGLVEYAQERVDQNRRIFVTAFIGSGIKRTRTYLKDEYSNILSLIEAYPGIQNGLDFGIRLYGDGRREFEMYYPRKGIRKPQYALELDQYGRTFITGLKYNQDAAGQANDIFFTGVTETQEKIFGRYELQPSIDQYGRKQLVFSGGHNESLGWLNSQAEREANRRGWPISIPDIDVDRRLLGLVEDGDILPIRIDYGAIQVNGDFSVEEITWTPESLTFDIEPI